jgi:glycosyltransferase involved in cell wall biosynthesis
MPEALVSVIVPVYRGERHIAAALRSVAAQSVPNIELIVVDDGSDDASAEIAAAHGGAQVLREPHRGVSAARNRGAVASHGELIAFLDADDEWLPGKLEAQVAVLRARPEVGLVHTHVLAVLAAGLPLPSWLPADWCTTPQPWYGPSNWLVRREVFALVGPFDERLAIGEEQDWLGRARDAGVTSEMLAAPLVRWNLHGANTTFHRDEVRRGVARMLHERITRENATRGVG